MSINYTGNNNESPFRKKVVINIPKDVKQTAKSVCVFAAAKIDGFVQALDLDSLYGHLEFKDFKKYFKGDLTILLDNNTISEVKRPEFGRIKVLHMINGRDVRKLQHVKIGNSQTQFGPLDIYIVAQNAVAVSNNQFKEMVYNIMLDLTKNPGLAMASGLFVDVNAISNRNPCNESAHKLTENILNNDLISICDELSMRLEEYEPVIYMETFGNKRFTIMDKLNFESIKPRILTTFDIKAFKYLNVDVCISSSAGKDTVTMATQKLFDNLKLTPNYIPLFSDTMLNLHLQTMSNTGKLSEVGERFKCFKLN